ncbi:hypothetical protein D3C84_957570 [compost metagenome]
MISKFGEKLSSKPSKSPKALGLPSIFSCPLSIACFGDNCCVRMASSVGRVRVSVASALLAPRSAE